MTLTRVWLSAVVLLATSIHDAARAQDPKPAGTLRTRWADDVAAENVLNEYPRPQMVRDQWLNLNGEWEYAIRPKDEPQPKEFDGKILVPFAVESQLSGVQRSVGGENRLWYRRTVEVPKAWWNQVVVLHFGAVDWETTLWVNGKEYPQVHRGGYDSFAFGVSDEVRKNDGRLELVVSVWDPTDAGSQPRGKQVAQPEGIWYTPVTGIWQTVWLEAFPTAHIQTVEVHPDVDNQQALIIVKSWQPMASSRNPEITVRDGNQNFQPAKVHSKKEPASFQPNMGVVTTEAIVGDLSQVWSPDKPHLYDLEVAITSRDEQIVPPGEDATADRVASYFGMRKIDFRKDVDGFNRLFLNNEPLFQFGPLDQGWWPDGLYTAPTDEALKYDIEMTKKLGFNMCRKHVKVEPARWYYWADKLGLLVWQDMPSGMGRGKNQFEQPDWEHDAEFSQEDKAQFRQELQALIDTHRNHPSIVAWVPFNEGWGQHDTNEILKWVKEYDPSRLVVGPSGWTDRGYGDMKDMHRYPGPGMFPVMEDRVSVLGEFGGLGLPVEGHTWLDKNNWGYRTYTSQEELQRNYEQLIRRLRPLIGQGLAAAVYTQTTDVEVEVNGLMTYDRALVKLDAERIVPLHERLYQPPGAIARTVILPTSEEQPRTWRYRTDAPPEGWEQPDYDDKGNGWKSGEGGFGEPSTPGSVVKTEWKTEDIWLRQTFTLEKKPEVRQLHLRIHHDEDAEIYLNGVRIAQVTGYTTGYEDIELDAEAAKLLSNGINTLAVHCRQTGGGQYIDVGLIDVKETPRAATK